MSDAEVAATAEAAAEVDVDAAPPACFGLADEMGPRHTPWHRHRRHQILYALTGSLKLEVTEAQWLLPPQRAAFIPAGCEHRVRCQRSAALRTVYLDTATFAAGEDAAAPAPVPVIAAGTCVFSVTSLAREMLLYAMRWGPLRSADDRASEILADAFFSALALLSREWIRADAGLRLPRPRSPDLSRACEHALADLAAASMARAARAAAVSPRTLARRFRDETQMSWRSFLRTARVLRAMELLAEPGARVTEVALSVGFDNPGAFSTSFRALTGESPSSYQRRFI